MTSQSLIANDLTVPSEEPMPNANADIETVIEVQEPFSIFSVREKWFIVTLIAFGGLFSPLTANIYLPAIPALTRAFHKSTELINITVTVYMVFQGITPMLFGTLADQIGRRPIFSACLLILSLSCIGLALVPTSAYWLLVLLRCIQAAGSASTIALGAGVIGDIATPAERGGFFGVYNMGPNLGPALGPVIGGLLSDHLGWRSIFWFLCIASMGCFITLVLFLPETLRALVGNGAIVPSKLYRPVIPILGRHVSNTTPSSSRPDKKPFKNPLLLLRDWDIVLSLFITGITTALYYGVIASISTLFERYYPALSETQIGLCYMATAGGMMLGTTLTGRLLDLEYRAMVKAMAAVKGEEPDNLAIRSDSGIADDFPIEKARLRMLPPIMLLFSACLAGYGWCIEKRVNLAGPLILQAAIGFVAMSSLSAVQTLTIDWVPTQGSSVTACSNIIRCSLGAGLVVLMEPMLAAIDPGWTYVILGGIGLLTIPLLLLVIRIGPSRRRTRKQRAQDEASK